MNRPFTVFVVSIIVGVASLGLVSAANGQTTQKTTQKTKAISQWCEEAGAVYEITGTHEEKDGLRGKLKAEIKRLPNVKDKRAYDESTPGKPRCLVRYTLKNGTKAERLFDNSGKENPLKQAEKEYIGREIAGEIRYDRYIENGYLAKTYHGKEFSLQAAEYLPAEADRLAKEAELQTQNAEKLTELAKSDPANTSHAADAAIARQAATGLYLESQILTLSARNPEAAFFPTSETDQSKGPPLADTTFPSEPWDNIGDWQFPDPVDASKDAQKEPPDQDPPTIWDNIRCDIQNNCPEEQPVEYGPTLTERAVNAVERVTCSWGYCSDEEADAADKALKDKESYATWPRTVDTNAAELQAAQEAGKKAAAEYLAEDERWDALYRSQNENAIAEWRREEAEQAFPVQLTEEALERERQAAEIEFAAQLTEETLERERREEAAREAAEIELATQLNEEERQFRDDVDAKMKEAREIAAANQLLQTEYELAKEAEEVAKQAQIEKAQKELEDSALTVSRMYCGLIEDDDYYGCLARLSAPIQTADKQIDEASAKAPDTAAETSLKQPIPTESNVVRRAVAAITDRTDDTIRFLSWGWVNPPDGSFSYYLGFQTPEAYAFAQTFQSTDLRYFQAQEFIRNYEKANPLR